MTAPQAYPHSPPPETTPPGGPGWSGSAPDPSTAAAAALEHLADEAALAGLGGLQDACLLLMEALQVAPAESRPALLVPLDDWPGLVRLYRRTGGAASGPILDFLRRPEWRLPLSEEEFELLAAALQAGQQEGGFAEDPSAAMAAPAADRRRQSLPELADEAARDGLAGLQEACLLLLEARGAAPPESAPVRADSLAAWPGLVAAYRADPEAGTSPILAFLRHPQWALPLLDEEFAMLEEALRAPGGSAPVAAGDAGSPLPEAMAVVLQRWADAAAGEARAGLQEACLLLSEALGAAATESRPALAALLEAWPGLVDAYRRDPAAGTGAIIAFLRRPEWGLPLAEEEFAMIEAELRAGSGPLAADSGAFASAEEVSGDGEPSAVGSPAEPAPANPPPPPADLSSLPRAVRELIELLLVAAGTIDAALAGLSVGAAPEDIEAVQDALECFTRAARTVGFEGLADCCGQVERNLHQFRSGAVPITGTSLTLLREWLTRVLAFLPDFASSAAQRALVAQLRDRPWPMPLPADAEAAILRRMSSADAGVGAQPEAPRRAAAAAMGDVALDLPEDANRELVDILLQELPGYTEQFSECLQRLGAGGGQADIETAQRVAHTLKGSANTVGIRGIAVLTHQLEDILLVCARERRLPGRALLGALIDAADCLQAMSDTLLGLGEAPAEARAVLQTILDWANRIDREGVAAMDADAPPPSAPGAEAAEPAAGTGAAAVIGAAPQGTPGNTLRVASEQIETLFRLSGESIILNSQAQERLERIKSFLDIVEKQFTLLHQFGGELEELIDTKDLSGRLRGGADQDFDALEMDQYNELHTLSRRMVEATVDARQISLDIKGELGQLGEVLNDQQHQVIDIQEAIMGTRLVPIVSILPRLQRSLRQTCRLTGKQAELSLSGGHLLIDGDTLASLLDPLMHLLRNAVDHGLESAPERLAAGKPPVGRIAFEFDREGNSVAVRCRDDGRGLDLAAIRAAALQRGLLPADRAVPDGELERLILRPNFSTRGESTQISGRGVGMDVVQVRIAALGGTLALDSVPGQGLAVTLKAPLPLSRAHALLAWAGRYRVAIANKGLTQIFYGGDGEWLESEQGALLRIDGDTYPAARLKDLLRCGEQRRDDRSHGAVLLVQGGDGIRAVLVDAITDSRDIVIKNFGAYIPKIPGLIGATILGDGRVTPVLDIPELLRRTAAGDAAVLRAEPPAAATPARRPPSALVVEDSLSQRRALEQLLADAGLQVRTAPDGLEAAKLLARWQPDVVLTDLEMPRMNGIELTSHIRAQPETLDLPVLMVTSRTTQKHRQLAEQAGIDGYFTKPVQDEELLMAIYRLIAKGRNQEVRAG